MDRVSPTALPTFLGIGAARSGTSWMYACLAEHPEVFMASPKEVHYFDQHFAEGTAWYGAHFVDVPATALARGEITPQYLTDERAPSRIAGLVPDARLFASFRNPVDLVYSLYWLWKDRYPGLSLLEALDADPELGAHAALGSQAQRFADHFPSEQLHFYLYDDLKARPAETVRAVYTHLGVTPSFTPEWLDRRLNAVIFPRTQQLMRRLRLTWIKSIVKQTPLNGWIRKLAHTKRLSYPPLGRRERDLLRERYQKECELLAQVLGRSLSDWDVDPSEPT